jgi:hypothetical protein
MAQTYLASVQGAALRVTRLLSTGATASGASASYVMNKFVRVSFTPEYEEGDEFTEKTADGSVCVTYKSADTLKRVNLEVAICEPDVEFTELIAGGVLLSSGGTNVGYASAEIGTDANPYGSALEVWSYGVTNGTRSGYFRWLFPYVQLRPTGERVIENGLLANTFEGYGVGNAAFGDGPQNDWAYTSDRAWAYVKTNTAPTGLNGYQTAI